MELEQVRNFIEKQKWIYAKTMEWCPHWYCLRKENENEDEFVEMVLHIREFGIDKEFCSKMYRYFIFEGYQYWEHGDNFDELGEPNSTLINRAKV